MSTTLAVAADGPRTYRRRMTDQIVLVTGGSRGIGAALASAHRARGNTVVVTDNEPTGPDEMVLDVRDREAFARVAAEVVARHGRIDIFHNNAGIAVAGTQLEMTPRHWDDLIDVDLRGVVHGIEAVYPIMRRQGHGHIVNTGSLAGILPVPAMIPYSSVKAAVVTLSRALRVEAREHGVAVTVVCPAFVETPLLDHINPGMSPTWANRVGIRLIKQVQGPPMDPDKLAEIVLDALPRAPETILAPRPLAQLAVLGERLVPGVVRRVSGLVLKRYQSMADAPV
jgi:NAD(P)-dependent dehydrogenase (short-subunit alcohol dehydrogenase family)